MLRDMSELELLASGQIPERFPYKFGAPTDAASPYSLCLAFFPEAVTLPLHKFNTEQERDLPEAIAEYVKEQCVFWGWKEDILDSEEPVESLFVKAWLRKTDDRFRKLDSVSGYQGVNDAWFGGIVRVLQLWRKFDQDTQLSLAEFENESEDVVLNLLVDLDPPGWTLRQKLEFLILPYLRYNDRVDLVQAWVAGAADLEQVADAVFAPELASSLLQLCFSTSSQQWRVVQHVIANVRPVDAEHPSNEEDGISTSKWEALLQPTKSTLEFFGKLVETAKTGRFPNLTFQNLAEWTLGSADTQQDLLVRFLEEHKHFTRSDLDLLRQTVFLHVPDEVFATEVVRGALDASRFMFLKSYSDSEFAHILKSEVQQMVQRFGTPEGRDLSLEKILTMLEIVDIGQDVTAKFERLQQLKTTFSIDPVFAMNHPPMELVRYALEHGSQTYLRFSQLQSIAGKENGPKIAELCIEAALADDNFGAACELIDRRFVKESSAGAWLALFEVGKFVSPQWDLPRPLHVLQKQQQYLSRSISLCPDGDLPGVLRAWSTLEQEHESAEQAELGHDSFSQTSPAPSSNTDLSSEHSETRQSSAGARDQLSNLLVSGIGWAIGANQ